MKADLKSLLFIPAVINILFVILNLGSSSVAFDIDLSSLALCIIIVLLTIYDLYVAFVYYIFKAKVNNQEEKYEKHRYRFYATYIFAMLAPVTLLLYLVFL